MERDLGFRHSAYRFPAKTVPAFEMLLAVWLLKTGPKSPKRGERYLNTIPYT